MTRGKEEEFDEVLAKYLPVGSDSYQQGCTDYGVLKQVQQRSDGHGVTIVRLLKTDDCIMSPDLAEQYDRGSAVVKRWTRNAKPYNGTVHNVSNDRDIVDVMSNPEKREKDLATLIGEDGDIIGANVPLPMDVEAYQDQFGIKAPIWEFLGYSNNEEAPGGRTNSAICATNKAGPKILIITLGETRRDGTKGSINVYYCGDRIYSETGRQMRWDLAESRPEFPALALKPVEHVATVTRLADYRAGEGHRCGGAYRPDKLRAAAGPV